MAAQRPNLCLGCDQSLEPAAWLCPHCGGPTLEAPVAARWGVRADDVVAMAARKAAANLLARWDGELVATGFESALKDGGWVAAPVTAMAAQTIVARLKAVGVTARVFERPQSAPGPSFDVLRPLPLILIAIGGLGAWYWHWSVGLVFAALAAAAALWRSRVEKPLLAPRLNGAVPESIERFQERAPALGGDERVAVATIVAGAARLLERAAREGLTVDPTLDYGMGGAVAGLLAETEQVLTMPPNDPARVVRLKGLAATVTELTAQSAPPLKEGAEARLRREALAASQILHGGVELPPLDKLPQ